jgi:hypothetical protein
MFLWSIAQRSIPVSVTVLVLLNSIILNFFSGGPKRNEIQLLVLAATIFATSFTQFSTSNFVLVLCKTRTLPNISVCSKKTNRITVSPDTLVETIGKSLPVNNEQW